MAETLVSAASGKETTGKKQWLHPRISRIARILEGEKQRLTTVSRLSLLVTGDYGNQNNQVQKRISEGILATGFWVRLLDSGFLEQDAQRYTQIYIGNGTQINAEHADKKTAFVDNQRPIYAVVTTRKGFIEYVFFSAFISARLRPIYRLFRSLLTFF